VFYDCYTALCQARGISRSRAAQEMGLSNSTVTKWKNTGATPSGETLARVSAYFGVPVGELLGEAVPSVQEERKLPEGAVPFDPALTAPLLGTVRAGLPMYAEENIEGYIPITRKDGARYFWLRVRGDSMNAVGISENDEILVREQPEVENGEIAAVRIGEEATLKHVYLHENFIELRPENPAFNSIILSREDMNTVVIEGKAVGLCRDI
jgi:repressor LexA